MPGSEVELREGRLCPVDGRGADRRRAAQHGPFHGLVVTRYSAIRALARGNPRIHRLRRSAVRIASRLPGIAAGNFGCEKVKLERSRKACTSRGSSFKAISISLSKETGQQHLPQNSRVLRHHALNFRELTVVPGHAPIQANCHFGRDSEATHDPRTHCGSSTKERWRWGLAALHATVARPGCGHASSAPRRSVPRVCFPGQSKLTHPSERPEFHALFSFIPARFHFRHSRVNCLADANASGWRGPDRRDSNVPARRFGHLQPDRAAPAPVPRLASRLPIAAAIQNRGAGVAPAPV